MIENEVKKIMDEIKNQIQNSSQPSKITSENIISLASSRYQEQLSHLDSKNLERVAELDAVVSKEQKKNNLNIFNDDFDENLIQANLSYDIQTINKIDTFKPKLIRKLVLKFRNLIQNEVRFALNPIVDKQIKFNINITRSVNGLKKILDSIELKHQLRIDKLESDSVRIDLLTIFNAYHYYLKRDPTSSELKQLFEYDFMDDPVYKQLMIIKKSDEAKKVLKNELSTKGIMMYDDTFCYKKIDNQIIHFNFNDKNYLEPFSNNELYEPGTTNFLKKILKKGMNVINIGANIGYFTLLAARQIGPEGKVFAFEPFPKTVELLKKNIDSNGFQNVQIITLAVSDRKENSFLALKSDSGHNFVTPAPPNEYDYLEIITTTIDDYFDESAQIDFIIMDAEGYESRIFDGMKKSLEKNAPIQILTEYNPHTLKIAGTSGSEFLEKLEKLDFNIQIIDADGMPKTYIKNELLKMKFPNTATLFLTKHISEII
ncbi:FkbM family methyltransferase [Nitrosopumilus piranensis]|uniref:Methyltransferase FkbM domain-containing protein n=1 Tax=Nitrosopumilus piranensis TaxID=1582439 RepID=A0A0C5BSY9_9ARCH|nr:FkbM family methyltransferase [Nitrosopumilus piranensis]AJM91249.1 hypothetical protein NPIRD3C_0025 [Nitrosopumilus piranensis]